MVGGGRTKALMHERVGVRQHRGPCGHSLWWFNTDIRVAELMLSFVWLLTRACCVVMQTQSASGQRCFPCAACHVEGNWNYENYEHPGGRTRLLATRPCPGCHRRAPYRQSRWVVVDGGCQPTGSLAGDAPLHRRVRHASAGSAAFTCLLTCPSLTQRGRLD